MGKPLAKAKARLKDRQALHDKSMAEARRRKDNGSGFKRPGSMKKKGS